VESEVGRGSTFRVRLPLPGTVAEGPDGPDGSQD
jgi:signal transduction histidine kinase